MKKTLLALGIACVLGFSAAAASERPVPPLALAKPYQAQLLPSDYWISEKMDGARAYWDGAQLRSRRGLVFHAPAWFVAGFPAEPLDGELWMGRGRFEALMRTVRDREPDHKTWAEVRYWVFDLPAAGGDFAARQARLQSLVAAVDSPHLAAVAQWRVTDRVQLMQQLEHVVAGGGEGLMLQRADGRYRAGRHAGLLKLKPFADAEARVVGHRPGKGKFRGMLGALVVEDEQGRRFRLGSGFSDAERRSPPPLGSLVSYRYQGRTGSGLPRFARFLRVRPPE